MRPSDEHEQPQLDAADLSVLDEIKAMYSAVDPVPATLVDRLQFALDLESYEIDVLRPYEEVGPAAGARGGEEARTITFDSDDLTIMISASVQNARTVRVDGWLAPPGDHLVELRTSEGPITVRADDQGRFVMDAVPRGLAQILVRQALDDPREARILAVTPSIVL
ncbi:hypothetical protein [Sphaerisporangium perillae]|uniref:hypothetical protein n=1 Tax=Sphaerisporangium perillae TaxID=2935860 RepID=UPI00200C729D|nr:hypothetical protein [Sphaerisporangium perillae]